MIKVKIYGFKLKMENWGWKINETKQTKKNL